MSLKSQDKYFFKKYGPLVSQIRKDPVFQARLLHGVTLPPHERVLLRPTRDPKITEYHMVGSRGTAKCLGKDTEVLMFDGTLKLSQDVVVGDLLMGPDNTPRKVLGVTRGVGELFTVTQSSAEDYVVNGQHIISLKKANGDKYPNEPDVVNITVEDFLTKSQTWRNYFRGYRSGKVDFPEREVKIDPYLLGVWLGDGDGRNPKITSMDTEIHDYCKNLIESLGGNLTYYKSSSKAVTFRLCLKEGRTNPLWEEFKSYGLTGPRNGKGSSVNKHIPQDYLSNSEEVRLQLLAGIVDSDGTLDNNCYKIVQTNHRLAKNVKLLADTLGFRTSFRSKVARIRSLGYETTAYQVYVCGDINRIPTKLPRKTVNERDIRKNKDFLLSQVDVVSLGPGEYYGFTVDQDNLFLLADTTVTHNSFTMASANPVLYSEAFGRKKVMSLSASKFRGGKVIMEEALSFIMGTLDSQKLPGNFTKAMLKHGRGLKREGDRWYIPFTTQTTFNTVPTGNEESARGLRAHILVLDEADNWEKNTVDKIFGPFLAVGGNFAKPGSGKSDNKIFFTGTITHSHKDWAKALKDREDVIRKSHIAHRALEQGDFKTWHRMSNEDNERIKRAAFHLQRWDYTDLIIPEHLEHHDVIYPSVDVTTKSVEINDPDIIKYDYRDKINYIYTYPVNKNYAESQLDDGLTDMDSWAAEWRCQFIDSSGNVYPFDLMERATNRELLDQEQLLKHEWDVEELGMHYPPVLYRCKDPCVLGVDPARTSDFVGFVVIRLGELAEGTYNPHTGEGHTPYNNVIWAEQRKGLTIREIAEKIRDFKSRYNLVVYANPEDAPGIVIDARGAASGTTVQDELAVPSPPTDELGNFDRNWKQPPPMYDPVDKEYRHLSGNPNAWPGLRLLWTTDQINTDLVAYSKGQFEVSKLYLGKFLNNYERNDPEGLLNVGYIGVKSLKDQLLSIQAHPTKYAFTYEMPGDSRRIDMKKDLFSAFLYACSAARQHVALHATAIKAKAPQTVAVKLNKRARNSLKNHPNMRIMRF